MIKDKRRELENEIFEKITRPFFSILPPTHIPKVIFNPLTTIYFDEYGKKFVSKCHEEEFDKEKGLLMCIAKSKGFTHSEIKRLLKNATEQKPKIKK